MKAEESVYAAIHEAAKSYARSHPETDSETAFANGSLSMLMYLAENDRRAREIKARCLCETEIIGYGDNTD